MSLAISKTLASGKELKIQLASFGTAKSLCQALLKEVKKTGVKVDDNFMNMDVGNLQGNSSMLSILLEAILNSATSKDVEGCFWLCANSCLYNGQRITESFFDKEENIDARGDFYEIQFEIIKENIRPFFQNLLSKLKATLPHQANTESQK